MVFTPTTVAHPPFCKHQRVGNMLENVLSLHQAGLSNTQNHQQLTVRQDSSSPDRILSPSSTMSPAITALVVAIAGMMFPAIAERNQPTKKIKIWDFWNHNLWIKTWRWAFAPKGSCFLTLDIKATLHVHAEDVHTQVGCCSNKVHGWGVILTRREGGKD